MHGLTGGSWKRNRDRARATEMKDTRGNPAVTSGSETYRRSTSPRQLSTLERNSVRAGVVREERCSELRQFGLSRAVLSLIEEHLSVG